VHEIVIATVSPEHRQRRPILPAFGPITRRLLGFLKTFKSLQRHQRIEEIFAETTSKMYPFVVDGWQ
jgi:hypothetical protein